MFTTTTTFVVYILALLVIGIIAARVTSSLSDYVLGEGSSAALSPRFLQEPQTCQAGF